MSDSEEEEVADLSSPDVTTKYRTAGDIINKVLQKVCEACVDGADIATLCAMGDKMMEEECGKLYNKKVKDKKIEKGVAFPTCISCNELVGHFSPLKGESQALKAGDVAKVDMACHIDGFIAAAAHTVLVSPDKLEGQKADDKRADVIMAAWNAAEAALRLVQVGNNNNQITEMLGKMGAEFKCKPVAGCLSHQLKKHVIAGNKTIAPVVNPEEKQVEIEFEGNEVYCIDVVMSTGEGKPKETEIRNTVYKRAVEMNYVLKTQKARQFIHEVQKHHPVLPFSLRQFEDEQMARVGVSEAKRHELLDEYPVLKEVKEEFVAKFKFTVLLLPGGTKKITGLPIGDLEKTAASTLKVEDEDLKKILRASANPKKQKKKKEAEESEKKEEEKKEEKEEKKEKPKKKKESKTDA
eukprot:gnl/TRDRNA2_/TRDRNA2_180597_c0_seq1.p1 gnl/TRDRNA2_/TRDRNA2_180597_c0~~gnl/TRDRNA2_/TRDRNA2_180597_c0_seq1.p1  ORF type:complete len:446 (+),score=138.01 gnl/TRDRNA2_/TRDRNA2_180597_c0_seq1:113-1339(+)